MTSQFQEASWPDGYSGTSIKQILNALLVQRSLQVVGLSGLGKSTLLRYFFSHPELLTKHTDFAFDDIFTIYIENS